jgi:hypothetical protein
MQQLGTAGTGAWVPQRQLAWLAPPDPGSGVADDGDYGITGCWLFTLLSASCGDVTTDDESSRIDDL